MATRNLLDDINGIVFDAKPDAVPYNYRISYKVSQLCLIIHKCSIKGCSLIKLHMISYALCSRGGMDALVNFADKKSIGVPVVRFDPAVNKAIMFAVAGGLICQQKNGSYKLSDKGKTLAIKIDADDDILVLEKGDLSVLSKKLTETIIIELSETWRITYAEN